MSKSLSQRITDLTSKRAAIDAEVKRLQAQQAVAQRKADTRRKILIGAAVIADPDLCGIVLKTVDSRFTRADDRALLGLPPLGSTR